MDRESRAANYSRACWDSTSRKNREREIRLLAETLMAMQESVYRPLTCHLAFIHLPNPTMSPLMTCCCVWPAAGERESQLHMLAHAEDPVAMEPPAVTDFPTDKLGHGLKVFYHQLRGDHGTTLIGNVNYAWRSQEHETDVRLFTSCPDLARLPGAMPHIHDLARSPAW